MPERFAVLVNAALFLAGVVLYAMLLAMVRQSSRFPSRRGEWAEADRLPLATAGLGLVWNVGALLTFGLVDFALARPEPMAGATAFSALGFLPTVVVHSVLQTAPGQSRSGAARPVLLAAYGLSAAAALLHFRAALVFGMVRSSGALYLLTGGLLALIVPLAAVTIRKGRPGSSRRALSLLALAVFAVSALHLAEHDPFRDSWMLELVGHHSSLPLAIAILYQEYPFALADLFLKRAVGLLLLVALALSCYGIVEGPLGLHGDRGLVVETFLGLSIVVALASQALGRAVNWLVDVAVLRRPDYARLRAELVRALSSGCETPEAVLEETCARLSPALAAREVRWWQAADAEQSATAQVERRGTSAVVIVPTGEPPRYAISIGQLTGGRRLLSGDVTMLEAVANAAARRVDSIRLMQERYERRVQALETSRLATEAELRALRAQINPHFLFNALTTLGFLIQTAPGRAVETLMQLTELLRRVLRSDGLWTTLGEELELARLYLELERARFEERLQVRVEVPPEMHAIPLPSLLLQPLVENAVKHGIAPARNGGTVTISAEVRAAGRSADVPWLRLAVHNTGAATDGERLARGRAEGVGLRNLEQRLEHQYGGRASLVVHADKRDGTRVEVSLPISAAAVEATAAAEGRRAG